MGMFQWTYLSLSPDISNCETVRGANRTAYDVPISCFQLTSISSPRKIMKTVHSLYDILTWFIFSYRNNLKNHLYDK